MIGAGRRRRGAALVLILAVVLPGPVDAAQGRLQAIEARGHLTCGVSPGVAGFAEIDRDGHAHGFDVDICRAVATAILGDPDAVRFVPAATVSQFRNDPDIDLVVRRLTWTLTREASPGLLFGPIVFFDGQGFLAPAASGIRTVRDLDGKRVCVDSGEDWAGNLGRFARTRRLDIRMVVTQGPADSGKRLFSEQCDAYSADKSMLAAVREAEGHVDDSLILPEDISKEPLAPLLRQGDDQFFLVVRWTIFAMIEAEELGVTSKNADAMRDATNRDVARLLGRIPGNGKALGLDQDWAYRVIKAIGNYGEMFDRNVGKGSATKLDRGLNRLWTEGGLMYAPPLR